VAAKSLGRLAGDFVTYVQVLQVTPGSSFPAPDALRRQLLTLLEPVSKAAGDVPPEEIEEARFALVAWADEVVLRADWPGRDQWAAERLQMQLYRTTRGGNEFFEHLARLRPDQLAAREIYFLALALGFEGQYAGQEPARQALLAHQAEILRAAGRVLDVNQARPVTPPAYELEIDLPPRGGAGVLGWLLLMILGAGAVYGVLWLTLLFTMGEVPLPAGS
jgi:type IV/VI secretion system ImpK/VasF family protein